MDELNKLEIFIGLWKYLVYDGRKRPETDYPTGGIFESDVDILEEVLNDDERIIKEEQITKDEKRFTAYITDREYKDFIMAIDADRNPMECDTWQN